jgi:hypothetical protein
MFWQAARVGETAILFAGKILIRHSEQQLQRRYGLKRNLGSYLPGKSMLIYLTCEYQEMAPYRSV